MYAIFPRLSALRYFCASILALSPFWGVAQMPEQSAQPQPQTTSAPSEVQGGSATAGVFAPILDSEKRPITAGGFVKTGPIVFQDISEKSGLTRWHHTMGTPQKSYIIEVTGSGVALLDYRSEERRVGKECYALCRSRWSPYH